MATKAKNSERAKTIVYLSVAALVLVVVGSMLGYVTLQNPFAPVEQAPGEVPEGTAFSQFKFTAVELDKTGTAVTGATVRCWYDGNNDGIMQYSELGMFSEASGVYTSNLEYPIGADFTFWIQLYGSSHQVTYAEVYMTGQRNSDGTAKTIANIEVVATDDALTWDGTANGAAFDTTDYNATTSGTSGTLKAEAVLAAADDGVTSQIWQGVDYEKVYQLYKTYPYLIKWDTILRGDGDAILVDKDSVLSATFFCAYCTIQDKVDLQIDVTGFDLNFNDGVNWYFISFMDGDFDNPANDWFYNTVDSAAPRPYFTIDFGTATAAGTFLATYGIGLWQDVKYNEMTAGAWTKGTALALGTCGNAWGWVV
jgi:hypothetical protein